jgi:23S rRNA (cytidine1920-2'-O)/16S rRNA (cytidine1409-2'-O)-methyltransferase
VLPACLKLAGAGANLVVLVKPQFEVGRGGIGKGGVVRDATRREDAVMKVRHWIGDQTGWVVIGDVASPIAGKDGNIEHLIGARRDS